MAFPTLLLRGTQNQISLVLVQPIQAKSTSSKYKIGETPEIRESPNGDVSADPVEVASSVLSAAITGLSSRTFTLNLKW